METEIKKMNVTISPPGGMISQDWKRWALNTLRFFLPVLSLYLGFVSENLQDGLHLIDFAPNSFIGGTMSLYVINSLQDLITKITSEKKYVNGEKV